MRAFYQFLQSYRIFSWVAVISLTIFLIHRVSVTNYWKQKRIIVHDVCSYYGYLPAAFVYHDMTIRYRDTVSLDVHKQIMYVHMYDKRVFKTTGGVAMMWLPFFLGTEAYLSNYPESIVDHTGYTRWHHLSLTIAAITFVVIAMLFLRAVFSRYFSDLTTAGLLVIVVAGTNLYYYTVYESGMSHAPSFLLFSILLYASMRWNDRRTAANSLALAFLLGLITVVRPNNIIGILIPILWGVGSPGDLFRKIRDVFSRWGLLLGMAVVFFIPILPQMIYWKIASGHWVVYSYPEERFFFDDPKIIKGLFGFRKGWFVYCPLMLLGIPGIVVAFWKKYEFRWAALIMMSLAIYIVFSWWAWWYGGGYGLRALIDYSPVWLLFIGALVETCLRSNWFSRVAITLVVSAGVTLSIFQTWQYSKGLIHYDGMTRDLYRKVWLSRKFPPHFWEEVKQPIYDHKKESR